MPNTIYARLPCRVTILALVATVFLFAGSMPLSLADTAPPWHAQGASVETSESMTHVRMVSEEVLLVVEKLPDAGSQKQGRAESYMIGHVEAIFIMRNQGGVEEAFDVWFPLGAPPEYGSAIPVEGFSAWVDQVPATTEREQTRSGGDRPMQWATWPATFPPGQDVILRVAYDVRPIGFGPYGLFEYVLETGAGWWGPIGEGTVTVRLPHEVNESTAEVHVGGRSGTSTNSIPYTISGTEVRYHFTDLEPTEDSNIRVTVLAPSLWEEITAAQRDVMAMDSSPQAHGRLARGLVEVLQFERGGGVVKVGNSVALANLARVSFQRALELAPADVEITADYLDFLWSMASDREPPPEELLRVLDLGLELAPDDERVLQIQEWVVWLESAFVTPTLLPPATLSPTAQLDQPTLVPTTPLPTASPFSAATLTPTPRSTPTGTPVVVSASSLATATPLSAPTTNSAGGLELPSATDTPPPALTPASQPGGAGKLCPGAVPSTVLPLSVLYANRLYRRRRGRGETSDR